VSISQLTTQNNCKITFFPSHYVSGPVTGKRIGLGHEWRGIYYLDDRMTLTGLVASQPDQILLWHWRLDHPSLQ